MHSRIIVHNAFRLDRELLLKLVLIVELLDECHQMVQRGECVSQEMLRRSIEVI